MDTRRVIRALKTPVTLLLLAALVVVAGRWAWGALLEPVEPAPEDPCVVTQIGPELTPEHVYVRVYNGTENNGLAKRLASVLRADGFKVIKTSNADRTDYETSEIVGYAEDGPEVVLVRQMFPEVAFRADGRVDRTVDVVIGAEQPTLAESPALSVPLPDGTACLPQITLITTSG